MKKLLKVFAIAIIFVSIFALTGCKNNYSVYVFTSTGGYVTINDSKDKISLKEILYYNKDVDLTFNAHENEEHQFLYWLVDTQVYSSEKSIALNITDETVVKAMFEKSGTMSITFVDENNKMLTDSPITIQANEVMSNFPTIPVRDGYVGNFYCGEELMLEGAKYPYTTSKTFVLKYVEQKYTVNIKYENCTRDNVTVNLLENYSWTVDFDDEIKFSVTANDDKEYNIFLDSMENQIHANAYGIYTISNISKDLDLIISSVQFNVPEQDTDTDNDDNSDNSDNIGDTDTDNDTNTDADDDTNTDNDSDTNTDSSEDNSNVDEDTNVEDNKPTTNLDPNIPQCTITFDESSMPSTTRITVKSYAYEYDYIDSQYYVYKYLSFKFSVKDISLFPASRIIVSANGEELTPENDIYNLTFITENIAITVDMYYRMNMSINYGMVATDYYEDIIDGDYVPFYDAYLELHHSRVSGYMSTIDPDLDLITFYVNDTTKTMSVTEFIDYINSTIQTDPEYKITFISLANKNDEIFINYWANVYYEDEGTDVQMALISYIHQSHYTLHLFWHNYD